MSQDPRAQIVSFESASDALQGLPYQGLRLFPFSIRCHRAHAYRVAQMRKRVVGVPGRAQDVVQAREHDLEPPVRLVHQSLEPSRLLEVVVGVHFEEVIGLVQEQEQPTGVPAVPAILESHGEAT